MQTAGFPPQEISLSLSLESLTKSLITYEVGNSYLCKPHSCVSSDEVFYHHLARFKLRNLPKTLPPSVKLTLQEAHLRRTPTPPFKNARQGWASNSKNREERGKSYSHVPLGEGRAGIAGAGPRRRATVATFFLHPQNQKHCSGTAWRSREGSRAAGPPPAPPPLAPPPTTSSPTFLLFFFVVVVFVVLQCLLS